jgi:hypothetical protein
MNYAMASVSRHHGNLFHLIQKMESRFGPEGTFLDPLRSEVKRGNAHTTIWRVNRSTANAQDFANITQKYWEGRLDRLQRV